MSQFYKLKIKRLIKETPNAVSITFDIPTNLKSDFNFIAGQYITIKKEINGIELRRAYSICSSPESGELKVAVKAVENGTFSIYATTELKEGDILEVSKPEGRFNLIPESGKNYIAIAAGSGITPIMSMLKTALIAGNNFTLIYGNKSERETIFKEELETLLNQYSDKLYIHYIYSQEKIENALFGRCDHGNINFLIKNNYQNVQFDEAFLCGPENMIEVVTNALIGNNIAKENIHFELFSTPIESTENIEIPSGKTQITVILDDEETTFLMPRKKVILTAALDKDLDAPYSCQGGVCSSCLGRITSGEAIMEKNSILTDGEIEEGLILTCQAHPTTDKITIDYDNV